MSAACSGDEVSNGDVADKLWLFSYGEMMNTVYPSAGFSSSGSSDSKRSSKNCLWLRSPDDSDYARDVNVDGYLGGGGRVDDIGAVAPGFTLP